jgi:hypothetical protein
MSEVKDAIRAYGSTEGSESTRGTSAGGATPGGWSDVQRREGSRSDGGLSEGAGPSRPASDGDATEPRRFSSDGGGTTILYDVCDFADLENFRRQMTQGLVYDPITEMWRKPDREDSPTESAVQPVREDPSNGTIDPRFSGGEVSERPIWRGPMEVAWLDRPDVWAKVTPLLTQLCERMSEHGMTVKGLSQRIANGQYKVWILRDFKCLFLTSLYTQQNGRLMLSLSWAAGEGATDPNNGLQYIEAYARMHGCYGVEVMGRKGWERVLKNFGYNPFYVGVMKPL